MNYDERAGSPKSGYHPPPIEEEGYSGLNVLVWMVCGWFVGCFGCLGVVGARLCVCGCVGVGIYPL